MNSLARPLRELTSRFSGKFQAVLNSVRPEAGFSKSYEIFYLHQKIYRERSRQIMSIESQISELKEFAAKEKLKIEYMVK